jgi:hypothetical protein
MSKLYIAEYARLTQASGPGNAATVQAPEEPPIATQIVDFASGAAASAAFNAKTRFVRLHTDAICSVRFGAAPTATVNDPRMAAGQTELRGIALDGGAAKVSAIANT